jgi:hypothetical protein
MCKSPAPDGLTLGLTDHMSSTESVGRLGAGLLCTCRTGVVTSQEPGCAFGTLVLVGIEGTGAYGHGSEEIDEQLRALGARLGQGYHLGQPAPPTVLFSGREAAWARSSGWGEGRSANG